MKTLKSILLVVVMGFLMASCHDSYYAANTKNINKLDGEKQATAKVMVELNDHLMLLRNMNTLAAEKAQSRKTYLLATDLETEFKELMIKLEMKATIRQYTLADELSKSNNDLYYQLYNQPDENFDSAYLELSKQRLEELTMYLDHHIADPATPQIRELCNDFLAEINLISARVGDLSA